jgi:hypothetical protein
MLETETYSTPSIGVPCGPKTRVYTSHKPRGSDKRLYRFLPIRDLINDINDPDLVSLKENEQKARCFPVMSIDERPAHSQQMWAYLVNSESGLSSAFGFDETSVVHSDVLVTMENGQKETIARLLKSKAALSGFISPRSSSRKGWPTKFLYLKTYSFSTDSIESHEVHFIPWEAKSVVAIHAKKTDLIIAHTYVMLNQGLLANIQY